jgi:hypothetical protein
MYITQVTGRSMHPYVIHHTQKQTTCLGVHQPRPSEAGEAGKVDVALLPRVVAGDMACGGVGGFGGCKLR